MDSTVITSSNTGTQQEEWWCVVRVGRCKKGTSDRNSQSVLPPSPHHQQGQLLNSQPKLRLAFGFLVKLKGCTWHLLSLNSIPASAGPINRSITVWEMWMHFCRGCSCGPGKCPGSTIRKEKKKWLKKEESGLIFIHVYQIAFLSLSGKILACNSLLMNHSDCRSWCNR